MIQSRCPTPQETADLALCLQPGRTTNWGWGEVYAPSMSSQRAHIFRNVHFNALKVEPVKEAKVGFSHPR